MAERDGRNITVDALNERRINAVKFRLSGLSVAETALRAGLSQPTVIDAFKAYQAGGWGAVPVAPRGRGMRKMSSKAESSVNVKHFLDSTEDLVDEASARPAPQLPGSALTHLQRLEAESIHIMRELVAEAVNPVMLYSIGKDSSVMLHLALKAFYPAKPPFPLMHVDTTWKFRDMYAFRDRTAAELGLDLIVHINREGLAMGINPFVHGSATHTDIMKTQALRQGLDQYGFDAAFGGARRDEEKSRAKERIFSFRSAQHRWDPKNQRPELWKLYNTRKHKGESIRVFPLSNWTELDVWQYIYLENIPVVPLYFAKKRPVVERDGTLIMVDDDRMRLRDGEAPTIRTVRFRTLGCYPLTGAIESTADTLPAIIQEMLLARASERQGRVIDHDSAGSMEKKKQEGYF
jgi:sulfate adenylyltransferase subunit 2